MLFSTVWAPVKLHEGLYLKCGHLRTVVGNKLLTRFLSATLAMTSLRHPSTTAAVRIICAGVLLLVLSASTVLGVSQDGHCMRPDVLLNTTQSMYKQFTSSRRFSYSVPTLHNIVSGKSRVLVSATTGRFGLLLPILNLLWGRCGFTMTSILIGTREQWQADPVGSKTLKLLEEQCADLRFTGEVELDSPNLIGKFAQMVRLTWVHDPAFDDDDYIMFSDADMLPLGCHCFWQHDVRAKKVWVASGAKRELTGGNKNAESNWSMCFIGSTAGLFRSVLQGSKSTMVSTTVDLVENGFSDSKRFPQRHFDNRLFYFDQIYITRHLDEISCFPSCFQYNEGVKKYCQMLGHRSVPEKPTHGQVRSILTSAGMWHDPLEVWITPLGNKKQLREKDPDGMLATQKLLNTINLFLPDYVETVKRFVLDAKPYVFLE